MYTTFNFRTKKALKEAVARGDKVEVYQPGPFSDPSSISTTIGGEVTLEGPHYPEPHRWYARVRVKDGLIVKFIS